MDREINLPATVLQSFFIGRVKSRDWLAHYMFNSFVQWLQGVDRSTVDVHRQAIVAPDATDKQVTTPAVIQTKSASQKPSRGASFAQTDIDILQKTYGEFYSGMVITIPLPDACELLGRTRQRVDAFKKLQQVLKADYDVTLTITSRKTHNGKN